jgi:peptide-methionine (S)-S-oxide reductase
MPVPARHAVLGTPLTGCPEGFAEAVFGMGCFWGAEKIFWSLSGVRSTAVGYAGGVTPNPTYPEVCTARTGHAEVVRVVYDPRRLSYAALLAAFWEGHDPTQGLRQGNDIGPQYRSCIHVVSAEQAAAAHHSLDAYQAALSTAGFGPITTEIVGPPKAPTPPFFYAEADHQQYLAKHPDGYCGHGGTGVTCPVAASAAAPAAGARPAMR